ncbi:zinc finger (ccch type) motif-containing protein [Cystoisospora suis]|uniref:Zinc finger (Ccch type) motif-containing protein n=1 Tax=Cystoisospora suis TaxID=483139 RepID=A0A2C6KKA2_9APIC|nr:zinc finger (ccch type) motif-containing protein [Cystoisospora suis]
MLYKTNLCKFYLKGTCKRGHKCSWAHGETDIRPFPAFFKTRMCYNWIYFGTCDRQPCTYAHSHLELRGSGKALRLCNYYFRDAHCPKGARCPMAHDINQLDPAIKNLPPLLNDWTSDGASNSGLPPQPPPAPQSPSSDLPCSPPSNYQARRPTSALPVPKQPNFPGQHTGPGGPHHTPFHKAGGDAPQGVAFPARNDNGPLPEIACELARGGISTRQAPPRPLKYSCGESANREIAAISETSHPETLYSAAALSATQLHAKSGTVLTEGELNAGRGPAWSQTLFGTRSGGSEGDAYSPVARYPFSNVSSRNVGIASSSRPPEEGDLHVTRRPLNVPQGSQPHSLPPPPQLEAGSSHYLRELPENEAALSSAGVCVEAPQRLPAAFSYPVTAQSPNASQDDCYRQDRVDAQPLGGGTWLWRATERQSELSQDRGEMSQGGWPAPAFFRPSVEHSVGPDAGFRCLGGQDSSTASRDLSRQHVLYTLHAGADPEQSAPSRKASTAELYPSGTDPFGDIWALLDESPGPASSEPVCRSATSGSVVAPQVSLGSTGAARVENGASGKEHCAKEAERSGVDVGSEPLSDVVDERRRLDQLFQDSPPSDCTRDVEWELSQSADRSLGIGGSRVSRRSGLRGASLAPGARGTSSQRSVSGCPTVSPGAIRTAASGPSPNADCRYFVTSSSISVVGGAPNNSPPEDPPCSLSASCSKSTLNAVVESCSSGSSAVLRGLSPGPPLEPFLTTNREVLTAGAYTSGGSDQDTQQVSDREMQRELFPGTLPCSEFWNGEGGFSTVGGDNGDTGHAACCSPSHSNSSYNSSYSTSLGTSRNGSSDTAHNEGNRSSQSPPWGSLGGRNSEHPSTSGPSEESNDTELMRLTELFLHLSTSASTCGSSAAVGADTDARQAQRPHEGAAAST